MKRPRPELMQRQFGKAREDRARLCFRQNGDHFAGLDRA